MFNFLRFAQDHSIPYLTEGHHHTHRGWYQTHCPQCTDGTHGYHLGASIRYGNLNCWRCGKVRTIDYIAEILNVSMERAWSLLREYGERNKNREEPKLVKRRRKIKKPPGTGALLAAHRRYLESRGFDVDQLVEKWDLEATAALSGKWWTWRWRVVFPIRNEEGEVIAYGGRSILKEEKRRYVITEDEKCLESPRGFLYGIHKVRSKAVIVVEGAADVWKLGPGAVATLGIAWSEEKANKLKQFERRFIMFDNEPLAQKKARELGKWLALFAGQTEIIGGLKSDPGALSRREARRIKRELLGEKT